MKFSFSLDTVDLNNQAPNRNKRECKYYWEEEIFDLLPAAGFDAIAIPYDLKWSFGGRSGIPLTMRSTGIKYGGAEGFREYLASVGINKVTDIHFDPTIFSGGDGVNVLSAEINAYFGGFGHFSEEVINYAAALGCETVTLSASGNYHSIEGMNVPYEQFLDRTAELFVRLNALAIEKGIKLCVKNEFWSVFRGEKLFDLLAKLPETVLVGIDTANLKIAGVDPVSFIERCAGRIGSVMFTDTKFVDDIDAWKSGIPEFPEKRATKVFLDMGMGEVDFVAAAEALEKAAYDGWVIINNRNSYEPCRGMLRARRYIDKNLKKG